MTSKKSKTKKYAWRIFKIFWGIIGILILLWSGFWFSKLNSIGGIGGVLAGTALFAVGIYALFIYICITLGYFAIKIIIKLIKKLRN